MSTRRWVQRTETEPTQDFETAEAQKAFAKQEAALEENHRLKEELHWLKVENSGLKQTNSWWSKAAQR